LEIENLIIGACGTSFNASMVGAYFMKKLGCFNTVQPIVASEITRLDFPHNHVGLLSVSQSGETKDLLMILDVAKECGATCFNIVNKVESTLAREVKCGVFLNAGREISVASTKAFTTQVAVLALVAIWFS
jgi:glucosamine--fructose-6-phosphate aminotransferase (isomerizing)